jgi:hypothetical protein
MVRSTVTEDMARRSSCYFLANGNAANALLVAQGFDWVHASGAERWNHPADQSDESENEG